MEEKIRHLLTSVVHPETGQDIVGSGFIEHIASGAGKITVVLRFAKARDPFAVKIKNQAESLLREAFPGAEVLVVIKEGTILAKWNCRDIPDLNGENAEQSILSLVAAHAVQVNISWLLGVCGVVLVLLYAVYFIHRRHV